MRVFLLAAIVGCGEKDTEGGDAEPCPDGFGMIADGSCVPVADGSEADADADADADSDTDADADADTDADTDADPPTPGNSAPEVLFFGSSTPAITEGESVTFSAVVTDADGIEDVIGGVLLTEGGDSYGAFATSAGEGSYQITLSWAQIHEVEDIEFEGTGSRVLTARFYDAVGDSVTAVETVTLTCPEAGAACEGSCVNIDNSGDHCGACGNSCWGDCVFGECHGFRDCFQPPAYTTCNAYCASQGLACSTECTGSYPIRYYYSEEDCEYDEDAYTSSSSFSSCSSSMSGYTDRWFRCCCG